MPPSPRRRLVRGTSRLAKGVAAHPDMVAVVGALIGLVIAWPTSAITHEVPDSLAPLLAMMTMAPVLLLRRWPFVAWAVSVGGGIIWTLVPTDVPVPSAAVMPWPVMHFLVLLVTVLVAAMFARLVHVAVVLVATAGLFLLVMPTELKPWALGVVVIVAFGLLVRWLVLSRRQLAHRVEEAEVEKARRAVLEERGRIARELHDVVAHHMSMIVVQAQSAPYRIADIPPEAREEFSAIEESARQALGEVRGLLGVLRDDRAEVRTTPQPGPADITPLLEQARAAGMDLTWRNDLDVAGCPAGVGLVLHRVLGEALANAGRHAPGAPVEVVLTERSGAADLLVRNGPGSPSTAPGEGGGQGIPGMRARAEAVGGTLEAGPVAGGGFVVRARVPLTGAVAN